MIIHYCWLGKKEKPEKVRYCMESWKRICPDAEIREWNEENYDMEKNAYVRAAYREKKYAFATDYMRADILYRYGGVYLDTDVELIRDISPLLSASFMGFERDNAVATGLIMYASRPHLELLKEICSYYENISEEDVDFGKTVVDIVTDILLKHGLEPNGQLQTVAGFTIYPTEYFNPIGGDYGKPVITENTYSIHHYLASWKSPLDQKIMRYKVKYGVRKGKILFCLRHPLLALKKRRQK